MKKLMPIFIFCSAICAGSAQATLLSPEEEHVLKNSANEYINSKAFADAVITATSLSPEIDQKSIVRKFVSNEIKKLCRENTDVLADTIASTVMQKYAEDAPFSSKKKGPAQLRKLEMEDIAPQQLQQIENDIADFITTDEFENNTDAMYFDRLAGKLIPGNLIMLRKFVGKLLSDMFPEASLLVPHSGVINNIADPIYEKLKELGKVF